MFFPFFSARREREQERRTAQNEFLRQSLRNSQKLRALKGTYLIVVKSVINTSYVIIFIIIITSYDINMQYITHSLTLRR